MTDSPRISVIMNCFNGEKYLREAIDSVIAQSFKDWEIVFWDNQSTDKSADIFQSYKDSRLRYYYAPSHTLLYDARNYAIEHSRGEFLAFLDVDDWWLENKLEKQLLLFSDKEVGIVCGNFWIVSERKNKRWVFSKNTIPTGWVLNDLLRFYFVGLLSLVIRKSALELLDYQCDPRYHMIGDLDLVVRLSIHWKLDCIQEPVGFYRAHDNNESIKQSSRHLGELEQWIEEMSDVEDIRKSPNFQFIKNNCIYQKAMQFLLKGEKKKAYNVLRILPIGKLKIRMLISILLPISIIQKLKN